MVASYHIIGASGRSGAALCRSLLADGEKPVPVVRSAVRWAATGSPGTPRVADLGDTAALGDALRDATHVVSCAHARFAACILAAAPPGARFVFLGSTRKFTRWPDDHAMGVIAGETAFLASGRPGVMLHPTMIYGAQGEDNVRRLAAFLRWLPLVPLPNGGRALVQPIYQDDVTRCIRAALQRDWLVPQSLVIAGPQAVSYAEFVQQISHVFGLHPHRIVRFPAGLLQTLAVMMSLVPFVPRIGADEIRRLTEDKAFDTDAMRVNLGVTPICLAQGLKLSMSAFSQ